MPASSRDMRALFVICFVELLERLAGYLVTISLVFYLNEVHKWSVSDATRASGWVFGLSYAAAIFGGMLLDGLLGARWTTLFGLLALACSLFFATSNQTIPLWIFGCIFVVGNGLFKPGIVSLLNTTLPLGHTQRAVGFTWFYVAVNLGSACAPPVGAWLQSRFGWPGVSFASSLTIACGATAVLLGWRTLRASSGTRSAVPVSVASGPDRAQLLPTLLGALVVTCALNSQSTSTLLFWARDFARRDVMGWVIPPMLFAALPPAVVLLGTPILSVLRKSLAARIRPQTHLAEIGLGLALCGTSFLVMLFPSALFDGKLASPLWLVLCKVTLTIGEMLVLPSALSLLGSLVPPQRSGLITGLSFLAQAIGFWLGGLLGARWEQWSSATFFTVQALIGIGAAAAVRHCSRLRAQSLQSGFRQ